LSPNYTKTEKVKKTMPNNDSESYVQLLKIVEDHAKQLNEMRAKLVRISSPFLLNW